MRKLVLGCTVAVLTALSARSMGTPAREWQMRPPALTIPEGEVGWASWYGQEFQGLPTASGPPFDMNAMTCAHRTLPLGTMVRITNLVTFNAVILKVNDRGPFVRGRILDVSRAAAERLGFLGAGLTPVRIEIVSYPRESLINQSTLGVVASTAY
ncbi:MAG TPA: septal ring lytic transglycosylase RlpA family protein [Terriglobia bacterium]|nr:septal ring lytic transglycosylase RlpA family protein [Terriglobia bacterium]